ncbi:MAG: cytochrome P450 [Deltaproteobacteria bacterium]|nr:cytochrome P450 [Deltaproteobacteria bacterium]
MSSQPATAELEMSSPPVEFNPFLPEFHENPYPIYHRLRSVDPVHWSDIAGRWVLTRYSDCVALLRDATRFSADPNTWNQFTEFVAAQGGPGPLTEMEKDWMLLKDPPDHTRLRTLVTKAFTPRVAEGMRPRVQAIVDDLLDAVQATGRMDVIADLAFPLPTIVICEMLGVPPEDREQFKGWTRDLARSLDPIVTPEIIAAADQATVAFTDYFRTLIAIRRKNPQPDLLSGLIATEEQGDRLTEDELIATAILLLGAGHETTMNLIGNGMLALLRNPEQLEKLKRDPTLMPSAVEEFLRYDGSVQMTARTALVDVEVGGKMIPKGVQAIIVLGAANRDPAQFPDPDRLDITRPDNRHIVFSYGIHHCLGAPLARVEAQVTINTLLRRMPNLQLTGEPLEWRETVTLRGLKALPITF